MKKGKGDSLNVASSFFRYASKADTTFSNLDRRLGFINPAVQTGLLFILYRYPLLCDLS